MYNLQKRKYHTSTESTFRIPPPKLPPPNKNIIILTTICVGLFITFKNYK